MARAFVCGGVQRGLSTAVSILCCARQCQWYEQHLRAGLRRVYLICASHSALADTYNASNAAFARGVAGSMCESHCALSDTYIGFASSW